MLYHTNYGEEQAWQEFKHQLKKYRQAVPQGLDAWQISPEDVRILQYSMRLEYVGDPELNRAGYLTAHRFVGVRKDESRVRQHHVAGEDKSAKRRHHLHRSITGGIQQRYLGSWLKHSHLCLAALQRIILSLMLRMNVKKEIGNERRSLMPSLR